MRRTLIISLIILDILCCQTVQASTLESLLIKAQQLNLASKSTWLKLLHFEVNDKKSVVLADEFFISLDGRENPENELEAIIRAYFKPWENDNTGHPRCIFPARYYWLSKHLDLPDYKLKEDHCQKLENWALMDSVSSISLLLVSGYLGNPASTFGHSLLKFNTKSDDDTKGMFDLTLNYGALIPEHEAALVYVFRGLFGGYKAGFSDRYYYTKDLVYSRTEYRDIWDYRLNLTDYQRTLLILHIWEIVGKKFTYYFLDKNCAFRMAELIDLVIDEDFVARDGLWFLPESMFHTIKQIHSSRLNKGEEGLIENVHYIPSAQRKLYRYIKNLSAIEIKTINQILKDGIISLSSHLDGLSDDQMINVLDALLAYQQYRITSIGEEKAESLEKDKKLIMLKRLSLSPRIRQVTVIEELASPADGSPPMESNISYAFDKEGGSYVRLSWSPFKKEAVGQNSMESAELVVFDTALGIFDGGERLKLDQLDIIRILNLNLMTLPLEQEDRWSWKLRIGSNRVGINDDDAYDGIFSFGIGSAKKLNSRSVGYFMIDAAAHTLEPYARLRPHAGVNLDFGRFKTHVFVGIENDDYKFNIKEILGGQMQFQMTDRSALKAEVSNERAARYNVGLSYYW